MTSVPPPNHSRLESEYHTRGLAPALDDMYKADGLRRDLPWFPSCGQTYCVVIETESQFQRLAFLWQTLHAADPAPSPFASWEWAWAWWQWIGKRLRDGADASHLLIVAVLTKTHDLIGLFPFHFPSYHSPPGRFVLFRPLRAFGLLGKHYESLTEEPVLLLKPGEARRALESALHFLIHHQPQAAWDAIECWVQHSEHTLMTAPRASCSALQVRFQHRRILPVMELALPSSWAAFRSRLSKSMRDNIRYYPRLLTRHGHSWEMSVAVTESEVAQEVESFIVLHRQREEARSGEWGGGHLPSAVHRGFLQAMLPAMAAQRDASLAVLWINGRRAASQVLLRRGETCVFYYGGFDPAWSAYSPMTILHTEIMAFLLRCGVSTVNLLAGDAAWRTQWGARRTETSQQLSYADCRLMPSLRMLAYARQKKQSREAIEGKRDSPK